jgi:hypothetical protein
MNLLVGETRYLIIRKSHGIKNMKKLRRKYFVPNPPRRSSIITITSSVIRRLQFLLLAMVVGETGFEVYWMYNYWGKEEGSTGIQAGVSGLENTSS